VLTLAIIPIILWPFLVLLSPFGIHMVQQEKSGNPRVKADNAEHREKFPFYSHFKSGLPDFSGHNIPKRGKMYQNYPQIYQMVVKYTKWP
jgi:hypothetical protein